jgi:hypothetical protein
LDDNLLPTASKAETKADITDRTARTIIGAEAERREVKTARLRQARLEGDAGCNGNTGQASPRKGGRATASQSVHVIPAHERLSSFQSGNADTVKSVGSLFQGTVG